MVYVCYFFPLSTSFVFHALQDPVTRVPHRPMHEKRMPLASDDLRRKCVSCPFDPLSGRSSLVNLRFLCVLFVSFVNVINFSCVKRLRISCVCLCGTCVTGPLKVLMFKCSLRTETHLGPDRTRLKQNAQPGLDCMWSWPIWK